MTPYSSNCRSGRSESSFIPKPRPKTLYGRMAFLRFRFGTLLSGGLSSCPSSNALLLFLCGLADVNNRHDKCPFLLLSDFLHSSGASLQPLKSPCSFCPLPSHIPKQALLWILVDTVDTCLSEVQVFLEDPHAHRRYCLQLRWVLFEPT